jgi:hypothetical protein
MLTKASTKIFTPLFVSMIMGATLAKAAHQQTSK